MKAPKPNKTKSSRLFLVNLIWGKVVAIIAVAISLLAVAKSAGVADAQGFVLLILDSYRSLVDLVFGFLFGWITIWGFELDPVERQLLPLLVITVSGVSAWLSRPLHQLALLGIAVLISTLVFGFLITGLDVSALALGLGAIVLLPVYVLYQVHYGTRIELPFPMPWPNFFVEAGLNRSMNFAGLINLIVGEHEIHVNMAGFKLTVRMIVEYFITVASAFALILIFIGAGLVTLFPSSP